MQIVEGKDRPKELPSPTKNKKNTSLLLEFFVQDYLGKLLFCPWEARSFKSTRFNRIVARPKNNKLSKFSYDYLYISQF